MVHQGDSGGNMGRPSNPSGYFTLSFPNPDTFGAQASHQALFQENQRDPSMCATRDPQLVGHPSAADTLVPPAVAPQAFHFHFQLESQTNMTMPHHAGVPNAMALQYFSGTAAVQPPPHGMELAARVAVMNTLPSQHFQPINYYAHGWSQAQLLPPPPQQDAQILQHRPMVAMARPNGSYGSTSLARPMLTPPDWPASWAPPAQQPGAGGQTSWEPPVQQPAGGQASSWAWAPPAQQRPGTPAASPGSGSAQAHPPRMTGKKTFEEFLLEAGVLDEQTLDKIFLDEVAEEMHGDEQAELGHPVERDDGWVSLGDVLLALGAVSSSSSGPGPSTHQVRMPAQEAALGAGTSTMGGGSRDQAAAAAAEARERRRRRMGKRKEAAARHHRPDKHAAPRGSQNGPGAI